MFGRVQQPNVCKFYQQGRCKFGDGCKFYHPGSNGNPSNQNQNSFAALNNNNNQGNPRDGRPSNLARGDHYRPGTNQHSRAPLPYQITREGIEADLKTEKPQWPFSAYGPGRDAPRQLFGGFPLEQSFEEMRVMYYAADSQGTPGTAIQAEQELLQQSNQQVQQSLSNLDDAVAYVIAGKDEHPNRVDMCQSAANGQPPPRAAFGATTPAAPTGTAFGQPSTFGANVSKPAFGAPAFGKPPTPAFGAPAQPGASGQPSALSGVGAFAQRSAPNLGSTFGQASAPSQAGAFGQPTVLGAKPAFGQPAAVSQGPAFGQASGPGQTSAFGRPAAPAFGQSAFGQASNIGQQPGPFAQAGQATQPSPFAAAGQNQQPNSIGQSGQGNQSSPFAAVGQAQQPRGFGQPSTFGQPAAPGNAFGQPTGQAQQSLSPFGGQPAPAQHQASPLARPAAPANSAFGQPTAQQNNGFGQPTARQNSPFGQPTTNTFGQLASRASPLSVPASAPATSSPFAMSNGSTGTVTPDPSTYITRAGNNTIQTWKNSHVQYQKDIPYYQKPDRSMERIWHPDGPPKPNREIEAPPEAYDSSLEAAYTFLRETGTFKDGIMPEIAPRIEWIRYDV